MWCRKKQRKKKEIIQTKENYKKKQNLAAK